LLIDIVIIICIRRNI